MLGGVIMVVVSISSLDKKTEFDVFLYCRFSLFLKDPFSRIISRLQQLSLLLCGVGLTSPPASI